MRPLRKQTHPFPCASVRVILFVVTRSSPKKEIGFGRIPALGSVVHQLNMLNWICPQPRVSDDLFDAGAADPDMNNSRQSRPGAYHWTLYIFLSVFSTVFVVFVPSLCWVVVLLLDLPADGSTEAVV